MKVPAVGESISSGIVSVWHKKSGEQVKTGDPLFTLETDKVSTEIVAEKDGVLQTLVAEGTEVKIGEVVAEIEERSGDMPKPAEILSPSWTPLALPPVSRCFQSPLRSPPRLRRSSLPRLPRHGFAECRLSRP